MTWLENVADGKSGGLAIYRPNEGYPVTPTMTAEAWVCRQFFGVSGPGPASDEAAKYLLAHGPDRDPFNLYYWYYATLAMYQNGGESWVRWNARVRRSARATTDAYGARGWKLGPRNLQGQARRARWADLHDVDRCFDAGSLLPLSAAL